MKKLLYIKGGNVVTELDKLANYQGKLPTTGPDQFFLAARSIATETTSQLRLVSFGNDDQKLEQANIDARCYAIRTKGNPIKKAYQQLIGGYHYLKDTLRFKPDTILCGFDGIFVFFVLLSAVLTRAKLVYLCHNAINLPSVSRFNRWANKLLISFADQIIVHGPFLEQQVTSLGASVSKVHQFDTWPTPVKSHEQTLSHPLVVYLGRLEVNKGVLDLLNAFNQIEQKPNGTELWLVGDGSLLNELQQMKLPADVKLLGPLPHEAIDQMIKQASFIVTPTQSNFPEGRCMSAMEAFALGRTVIAPNFGPFPYLIDDQVNGLLYSVDDVDSLQQSINQLLNDPALLTRLNNAALTTSEQLYRQQLSFYDALRCALAQLNRDYP
ncbi:MAG: glycosyltransferase family 4 protein [Thiotrichales bacterium]|jgi:glycosyltransferase involved in cell wall biosynthesis|nr:glycosyltransferase family 4 protein [Thiotrichales bacterium]